MANTGTLITQAKIHNGKLLPPQKSIAANVQGNAIPICKRKAITSHNILLDSCPSHQLMNFEKAFTWAFLVVAYCPAATKFLTSAVDIACCITIVFLFLLMQISLPPPRNYLMQIKPKYDYRQVQELSELGYMGFVGFSG